jgi:hypothetical protein
MLQGDKPAPWQIPGFINIIFSLKGAHLNALHTIARVMVMTISALELTLDCLGPAGYVKSTHDSSGFTRLFVGALEEPCVFVGALEEPCA